MAEERSRKQPEVSLRIEAVPYRSAAWRELWRQIFIAVAEELARVPDPVEGDQKTTQSDENGRPE